MKPLISVIVPIFNAEKYLNKCINSIICQTYNNLEIILINDGSTDKSLEICEKYAHTDKRIKLMSKVNGGVSSARNLGLNVANGDYITFVDSDDWLDANMYDEMIKLIKNYDADIAATGYSYEYLDGELIRRNAKTKEIVLNSLQALKKAFSKDHYQGFLWNKLISFQVINFPEKLRFDEKIYLYEDLLFVSQCILRSEVIAYTDKPLYHYISLQSGAMQGSYNKKKATAITAGEKIFNLCSSRYPELKESLQVMLIKAYLFVLISMIQSGIDDKSIKKKTAFFFKRVTNKFTLTSELSMKEKLYVFLIKISPNFFIAIYSMIKIITTHYISKKSEGEK